MRPMPTIPSVCPSPVLIAHGWGAIHPTVAADQPVAFTGAPGDTQHQESAISAVASVELGRIATAIPPSTLLADQYG